MAAGRDAAILTVSVAAELAGMHPQTVRQYDRLGLVPAHRTQGGGRRYSLADVDKLIEIQELSQGEGINLAGISRIIELRDEVNRLKKETNRLRSRLARQQQMLEEYVRRDQRVFAAGRDGDVEVFAAAREARERLREKAAREQAEYLKQLRAERERAAEEAKRHALGDYAEGGDIVLWRPAIGRIIDPWD